VSLVQCAHGGHKAHAFAGTARFFAYGCNFSGGSENEHGERKQLAISNLAISS
jgi:hypothetical protein